MKDFRRNGNRSLCNRSKGFTLVELIVVLVIIAILAALAVPAFMGFIDDAHKKQVISRAQTALASTQASLSDIYTLNDNEFTVEKRDQTRQNAGESTDTAFTVWSERPLYDERSGVREATVAITEELGSYTIAQAIFDDGENSFAVYDGESWEVYDSREAAQAALGITEDDERVIYVWPYTDYSDTARQPGEDPKPDPEDPNPDPPPVLATKTVNLMNEKRETARAFFADDVTATEPAKPGISVVFSKIDEDNYETDWQWNDGSRTFSLNGNTYFLNLLKTYAFRYWTEEVTGDICRSKADIAEYIFADSRENQDQFTFYANVIRDDIPEQAVVSNKKLKDKVNTHDTDNVEQVPTENYNLGNLPKGNTRIDDESHEGFYIYAWYEGNTLKWWTNALVAFMPKDCSGMLSGRGRLHYFSFEGFDVSKIENANDLFNNSTKLHTIDFGSDFVAPKLTQMDRCFKNADAISGTFDLSGIIEIGPRVSLEAAFMEMDNVTGFNFGSGIKNSDIVQLKETFSTCKNLSSIELSGLKVSRATSCYQMIYQCGALTEVNLGGDFNLNSTTSLKRTFAKCAKLTSINGRIVTGTALNNMRECFDGDKLLTALDVSGIDPTNVTTFRSTFKDVEKLETLDLSAWVGKPKKVSDLRQTFFKMSAVKELNLSQWNLNDLKVVYSCFNGCSNAQIILDGWSDPALCPKGNKLEAVGHAFDGCSSMTGIVDLSNWETLGLAGKKDDLADPDTNRAWDPTYDLQYLFNNCTSLQGVRLEKWNFTNVQNFNSVFNGCTSLTLIDLKGAKAIRQDCEGNIKGLCRPNKDKLKTVILSDAQFDCFTSVATMYKDYKSLEYIDLTNFKALGATEAKEMFFNCNKLTTVKMSGLDLHMVSDASGMFKNCSSLAEFTESGFNMGSVTNMSSFFEGCSSLTRFNLSGLPVANVTNMNYMFKGCKAFKKLDMSGLPVKSAQTMIEMFSGCSAMEELNISGWELLALNNTANINKIFEGCSSLKKLIMKNWRNDVVISKAFVAAAKSYIEELDVSGCDLQNRSDMSGMFNGCGRLKTIDLNGFKTGGVTNMSKMFFGCSSLQTLDLTGCDVSNVQSMTEMFSGCKALKELNISEWRLVALNDQANINGIFSNCNTPKKLIMKKWRNEAGISKAFIAAGKSYIEELDMSGCELQNKSDLSGMFSGCVRLKKIDLSDFRTDGVTNMSNMFSNCHCLQTVDISGFDVGNVTTVAGMFLNCYKLTTVNFKAGGSYFNNVTTMFEMFHNCISLNDTTDITLIHTGDKLGSTQFMFKGCYSMPEISVENLNMKNVTTIEGMFSMEEWVGGKTVTIENGETVGVTADSFKTECKLKIITFGQSCADIKITHQNNVDRTFKNCIVLKTIYVYPGTAFTVGGGKYSTFEGCTAIVGGAGTTFQDGRNIFAKIDGGTGAPGYFTDITKPQ